jgi:dihydroorotate dehydrogenase (fumarate)
MLRTKVAGLDLDCCVYNASGPRTGSIEALQKIGTSKSGAILAKSATLVAQDGNQIPRFVNKIDLGPHLCEGSMNSEGLPNKGIDYYISGEAISALRGYGKPYIVSLSGLSLKDNLEMLGRAMAVEGIDAIELNLACPNIPGKPTIAYDFQQMEDVLKAITAHPLFSKKPLGVKLAPYFDFPYFEQATNIISKYPVKYVVTVNTIGNALFIDVDNECPSMLAKDGFGGLGGGFVKQTALANVRQLSLLFAKKGREDIDIVGVGGVSTGKDAFEMILCGAKAVQVGTCHWTEGPSCFARIAKELEDIMKKKGYSSIEDFRGKLKPYKQHTTKYSKKISSADTEEKSLAAAPLASENIFTLVIAVVVTYIVVCTCEDIRLPFLVNLFKLFP